MAPGCSVAAYFVGVALVGAGLGAVVANLLFSASGRDPHFLVVVLCAIAGAAGRCTCSATSSSSAPAFGGAWTLIVGAMALLGDRRRMAAAAAGDVWVVYPLDPAPGQRWVPVAWIVLGIAGACVQLGWTGGDKGPGGSTQEKI